VPACVVSRAVTAQTLVIDAIGGEVLAEAAWSACLGRKLTRWVMRLAARQPLTSPIDLATGSSASGVRPSVEARGAGLGVDIGAAARAASVRRAQHLGQAVCGVRAHQDRVAAGSVNTKSHQQALEWKAAWSNRAGHKLAATAGIVARVSSNDVVRRMGKPAAAEQIGENHPWFAR